MRFCSIASGSKGNSVYFESESTKILIDAGISTKRMIERLSQISVSANRLDAICITHEHGDHVRGLAKLAHDYNIPVFVTAKTFAGLKNKSKINHLVQIFESGERLAIKNLTVSSFPVPHDAADTHGFIIQNQLKRVAVATDLGYVTTLVRHRLQNLDWLILESNHDLAMLKNGPYPWVIKQRVMGKHGHLSNVNAANAIKDVYHDQLKGVSLVHLSETNNSETVAMDTVTGSLNSWNIKNLKVIMAYQNKNSEVIEL